MGRSPYDPSPSYTNCAYCDERYDNSGYYGSDDESHFCTEKLRSKLRFLLLKFPNIETVISEVREQMTKEKSEQLLEQKYAELGTLRNSLENTKKLSSELETKIQELESSIHHALLRIGPYPYKK